MKCCSLENHVSILAILHSILLCLSTVSTAKLKEIIFDAAPNSQVRIGLIIVVGLVYVALFMVYTICFCGAQCRRKCLLIPAMILKSIEILAAIGGGTFMFFWWLKTRDSIDKAVLLCLMGILGIDIYVLTVVDKLYYELSDATCATENLIQIKN